MATLLGSQNCMESLRKDITDLQGTVISVFSRAGAVRYPSWKFPDKVSCDLDLVALLDYYDYVENDPEFTQHSHVVLLELVIDRLLLLLQSFAAYTENVISEQAVPPSRVTGSYMSIGLAVKKYWNSMLKLGTVYQQLVAEKKHNREDLSSLKYSLQVARAESGRFKSCPSALSESDVTLPSLRSSPLTVSVSSGLMDSAIRVSSQAEISQGVAKHVRSIHSQTIESSLVPCDACERAQVSLKEVGNAIIHICSSQNLPSSLRRFLHMIEETLGQKPLTATDMGYWASEQSKDLSRINKHLQMLTELVNPLKEELEAAEKQKEELKKQLETFQSCLEKEKEAQEQQRKEAELLFEKKNAESLQLVATLEKDKEDLQKRQVFLEEQISTLKEEIHQQQTNFRELEWTKSSLLQEMQVKMAGMVDKSQVTTLEGQLAVLSCQLDSTKQQLNWTTTELEKEKATVESMLRHKKSLQVKQRALMQQLDNLDQECEQLKTNLADREDNTYMLQEKAKGLQEEKRQIQDQMRAQQELVERAQQEKQSMEQSVSELQSTVSKLGEMNQELKERERLLVSFPDLHLPVETQYESTGDIMEDMEKQLQANNIRISILEEENIRLRTAVAKMKEVSQQEAPKVACTSNPAVASVCKSGV
ncbi:coiled-coil domain-containing protein 157 isoform X2 [Heteronotia binoei]|uniref:coiled-coil domain-containing protein 157 isoform X2 n=1 Tax=Heteronotia binoei TaxID=13085 RepID=UPI0029317117|nr:coiled-coil domain-containing protein 157 isoform X2 [Heteronotia binoei]